MTADQAQVVTYSPALTLVPTYECFNRCSYCNFRVDPRGDTWLTIAEAKRRLDKARSQGIIEILILSGEVHPQSQRRADWLEHIFNLCQLALQMGFLPHTNAGPLREPEMALLKQVNVSMGLMLEQVTPTLLEGVHCHAPSKLPDVRLQQLEQAGKLRIPFTTGLLLGIGESASDRIDTLQAIAASHRRWGHIQEVILQPHQPGSAQSETRQPFSSEELVAFVKTARQHLPADITLQIPPNLLTHSEHLIAAIAHGASDLGGLGPIDEVNPDYDHPHPQSLRPQLQQYGWDLQCRLPVYPQYDAWLPSSLREAVNRWRTQLAHSPFSQDLNNSAMNGR